MKCPKCGSRCKWIPGTQTHICTNSGDRGGDRACNFEFSAVEKKDKSKTTHLMFKSFPAKLKHAFKTACKRRGLGMQDAAISLVQKFVAEE